MNIARDTEAVIRVLKFWGDAGARGAARHFFLMAPRPAARCSPRSFRRPLRIALRRNAIIIGVKPIRTPFVDIRTDVEEAVGVFLGLAYALGGRLPARGVIFERFEWGIAPGVEFLFGSAARGAFPFGFCIGKR